MADPQVYKPRLDLTVSVWMGGRVYGSTINPAAHPDADCQIKSWLIHLGIGHDASSARAYDRAGRRPFRRWPALDRRTARLSPAGPRAIAAVPGAFAFPAARSACRKAPQVFRGARRARR